VNVITATETRAGHWLEVAGRHRRRADVAEEKCDIMRAALIVISGYPPGLSAAGVALAALESASRVNAAPSEGGSGATKTG
jgi:hypothetical protein